MNEPDRSRRLDALCDIVALAGAAAVVYGIGEIAGREWSILTAGFALIVVGCLGARR